MHPAVLGALLGVAQPSVLESMPAYQALDVPGKVRARQVFRELMGAEEPPPRKAAPGKALHARIRRKVEDARRRAELRARRREAPPPLAPSRPAPPPAPGPLPTPRKPPRSVTDMADEAIRTAVLGNEAYRYDGPPKLAPAPKTRVSSDLAERLRKRLHPPGSKRWKPDVLHDRAYYQGRKRKGLGPRRPWKPEILPESAYRYREPGHEPASAADVEAGVPPGRDFPRKMWARTGPASKVPTPPVPRRSTSKGPIWGRRGSSDPGSGSSPRPDRTREVDRLPGLQVEAMRMVKTIPVVGITKGTIRHRPAGKAYWLELYKGKLNEVEFRSMLQTQAESTGWVVLPKRAGRLDLAPGTSVEINEHTIRLVRGEIKVRVPGPSKEKLRVETPRGTLLVGPGGIARVRPKGFARVRGPVEKAG